MIDGQRTADDTVKKLKAAEAGTAEGLATIPPAVVEGFAATVAAEGPTARRAVRILLQKELGFHEPSRTERKALLVGFAMHQRVLYGAAYDVIRLSRAVDLADPKAISDNMDAITFYEVKSTNRKSVKADLKGYFFNLTTAELLVAQSLGEQFRFAFVNVLTAEHQDFPLAEIYKRARAIYPAWHIRS